MSNRVDVVVGDDAVVVDQKEVVDLDVDIVVVEKQDAKSDKDDDDADKKDDAKPDKDDAKPDKDDDAKPDKEEDVKPDKEDDAKPDKDEKPDEKSDDKDDDEDDDEDAEIIVDDKIKKGDDIELETVELGADQGDKIEIQENEDGEPEFGGEVQFVDDSAARCCTACCLTCCCCATKKDFVDVKKRALFSLVPELVDVGSDWFAAITLFLLVPAPYQTLNCEGKEIVIDEPDLLSKLFVRELFLIAAIMGTLCMFVKAYLIIQTVKKGRVSKEDYAKLLLPDVLSLIFEDAVSVVAAVFYIAGKGFEAEEGQELNLGFTDVPIVELSLALTLVDAIMKYYHSFKVWRKGKSSKWLFIFSTFAAFLICVVCIVQAAVSSPLVEGYFGTTSFLKAALGDEKTRTYFSGMVVNITLVSIWRLPNFKYRDAPYTVQMQEDMSAGLFHTYYCDASPTEKLQLVSNETESKLFRFKDLVRVRDNASIILNGTQGYDISFDQIDIHIDSVWYDERVYPEGLSGDVFSEKAEERRHVSAFLIPKVSRINNTVGNVSTEYTAQNGEIFTNYPVQRPVFLDGSAHEVEYLLGSISPANNNTIPPLNHTGFADQTFKTCKEATESVEPEWTYFATIEITGTSCAGITNKTDVERNAQLEEVYVAPSTEKKAGETAAVSFWSLFF